MGWRSGCQSSAANPTQAASFAGSVRQYYQVWFERLADRLKKLGIPPAIQNTRKGMAERRDYCLQAREQAANLARDLQAVQQSCQWP